LQCSGGGGDGGVGSRVVVTVVAEVGGGWKVK